MTSAHVNLGRAVKREWELKSKKRENEKAAESASLSVVVTSAHVNLGRAVKRGWELKSKKWEKEKAAESASLSADPVSILK